MQTSIPVQCTMVSVLAVKHHGGEPRVLVVRRADAYLNGVWTYTAGHVEAGEAGWRAALRELYEETGLVPDQLYATSFCEQFYSPEADSLELVPAFVAQIAAAAAVRLNAEHSAFRWVSIEEAADLLPFGSQRDLIAHVRREFIERRPAPYLRITTGS